MRMHVKNIKKTVLGLMAFLMVLTVLGGNSFVHADSTGKQFVYDYADVLTDKEEKDLEAQAHKVSESAELDLVIVFVNQKLNTTKKITSYGDGFYDQYAFGYNRPHGDGMILVVDPQARNYYVGTSGQAFKFFSESRLDQICSDIVDQLSDDDWKGGAQAYLKYVDRKYRDPDKPITWNDRLKASAGRSPLYLLIALVVSAIIQAIGIATRGNRKTTGSATYLRPGSFRLLQNEDAFVGETTTRVRKVHVNTGSGGSGSGSGRSGGFGGAHISSGGFSHGGRAGKF